MSEASQLSSTTDRIGDAATRLIGNMAGTAVEPQQGAKQLAATVRQPGLLLALAAVVLAYLLGRRQRG